MKSGKLNFLEPSGPLQACNGTDLPFIVKQKHVKQISNGPTLQGISLFISVGPKAELNPEHFNHQVRTTTSWYNANYLCYNPRMKEGPSRREEAK